MTKICKQSPIVIGYYIVPELNYILKSDYCNSPLGYENIDWFVNEDMKLESKMNFHFKSTKKGRIMTVEDEENYKNKKNCRFCEEEVSIDKVRDHCQLTSKKRGPAHNTCNINVTQEQSKFIPFIFCNFSNKDFHLFFKKLFDERMIK